MKKLFSIVFILCLFIFNIFCITFQKPSKEDFDIFVSPTKKVFKSNEVVTLFCVISLKDKNSLNDNVGFQIAPFQQDIFEFDMINSKNEIIKQHFYTAFYVPKIITKKEHIEYFYTEITRVEIYNCKGSGIIEYVPDNYKLKIEYPILYRQNDELDIVSKYIIDNIEINIYDSLKIIEAEIKFNPHKWNSQWCEVEPEGYINCFIGNLESGTVEDIVQDDIWLNGNLKPETVKIQNHHAGFDGKVLHLQFKMKDVIKLINLNDPYGIQNNVNVQAKLKNGKILNAETNVEILFPKK